MEILSEAVSEKAVDCTVLERHGSEHFQVGVSEMNGWRTSMEDAHVIHLQNDGGYFGILDGHGGAQCSAWCAKSFHEKLHANGLPANDAAAKDLCLKIDQAYRDSDTGHISGSTGAMCIVRPPTNQGETKDTNDGGGRYKIHVINVGDSRVLLSQADGTMIVGPGTDGGHTTDHKPGLPSERERIERTGGMVEARPDGDLGVNGSLAVSRSFGDAYYKRTGGPGLEDHPVTANPEMNHFECNVSDFVLVVCDGVSEGNFPNAKVCQLAAKVLNETGGDAAAAAEAICIKSVEMGSKDNISAMIILLGPATDQTFISLGKTLEFNPGTNLKGTHSAKYIEAYTAMCVRGGVTFLGMEEADVLGDIIGIHSAKYIEAYTAMYERGGVTFSEAEAAMCSNADIFTISERVPINNIEGVIFEKKIPLSNAQADSILNPDY